MGRGRMSENIEGMTELQIKLEKGIRKEGVGR